MGVSLNDWWNLRCFRLLGRFEVFCKEKERKREGERASDLDRGEKREKSIIPQHR